MTINVLILGAGWTSTFLIPLCRSQHISYAATTRSGTNDTIMFSFDQNNSDEEELEKFKLLPDAKTVLITFPITVPGASDKLVRLYTKSREDEGLKAAFVQLGATSIWGEVKPRKTVTPIQTSQQPPKPAANRWYDRHSQYNHGDRVDAEDELLALAPAIPTTVLNLAGLYGGDRSMKKWVGKVAPTKEILEGKGSIHMIHGIDLARAILAVHSNFSKANGQRWLLTDGRVYDWWDLASAWGSGPSAPALADINSNAASASNPDIEDRGPQAAWVQQLMRETGVRALPRSNETLGRALDSREFWETFGLTPVKGRMEEGWRNDRTGVE